MNVNKVFIAGNITKDIELRYTSSGKAVANFTVAVNDYGSDNASFFRVTVWEKIAENCSKYLSKGSPVFVEGRLVTKSYEHEGQKKISTEIVAQNVQFVSPPRSEQQSYNPPERKEYTTQTEEPDGEDIPF